MAIAILPRPVELSQFSRMCAHGRVSAAMRRRDGFKKAARVEVGG